MWQLSPQRRMRGSSRQQRRAQPETQFRDWEQESIAAVDYEDPGTTEIIEAYDARTGERLDSEEVRKGRAKEVQELDEFDDKIEFDESEMRVTPGKKICSKWVETRKDPNSLAP